MQHLINNLDYQQMLSLIPYIQSYQDLAKKYNIKDIFQDNGGKYLQLFLILNLQTSGKREGNDAFDNLGVEYEVKTLNKDLVSSFSTHHHINPKIIEKYRKVDWYFAVYSNIELQQIYKVKAIDLDEFYIKWENKWQIDKKDINNPKIPLKYVMEKGELIWSISVYK